MNRAFRRHDLERPTADVMADNFARLHGRPATAADLDGAYRREVVGDRQVVLVARWAAAAMVCPYQVPAEPGASYCAASRCDEWRAEMDGYGTCARIAEPVKQVARF